MEFKKIVSKCKWRVVSRESFACKTCLNQPNGTECSEDNCAPFQFAEAIHEEARKELHTVVKNLIDQIEGKLSNKKLMANYVNEIL